MPIFCDTLEVDGDSAGRIQAGIKGNVGTLRAIGTVKDSLEVGGALYQSFSTYANQSVWVEGARLAKDGKFGIGTTNPSQVLDVAGPGRIAGPLTVLNTRAVHQVYAMGDSLMGAGRVEFTLNGKLPGWSVRNKGIGGQTTTQMLARFSADILEANDAEVVIVWGGINDIAGNATATSILSNLQAMVTQAKAAGIKTVVVNLTPFKGNAFWTQSRQDVATAVNAGLSADVVVDAFSLLTDGNGALQAAYDSGDHLHLSNAGYDVVANAIYTATTWTPAPASAVGFELKGEANATGYRVAGQRVIGTQQSAIADATTCLDVIAKLNAALTALRAHGLIAS